jgi:hypothetical protein
MEDKKNKIKKDMFQDVAWNLFKETGMVAHYLFYKEIGKK